jgi:hypothetical protein
VISPFLEPVTRGKIAFVYGSKATSALLEVMEEEVLPAEFGGVAVLVPLAANAVAGDWAGQGMLAAPEQGMLGAHLRLPPASRGAPPSPLQQQAPQRPGEGVHIRANTHPRGGEMGALVAWVVDERVILQRALIHLLHLLSAVLWGAWARVFKPPRHSMKAGAHADVVATGR